MCQCANQDRPIRPFIFFPRLVHDKRMGNFPDRRHDRRYDYSALIHFGQAHAKSLPGDWKSRQPKAKSACADWAYSRHPEIQSAQADWACSRHPEIQSAQADFALGCRDFQSPGTQRSVPRCSFSSRVRDGCFCVSGLLA
jgi:hypothetical protein